MMSEDIPEEAATGTPTPEADSEAIQESASDNATAAPQPAEEPKSPELQPASEAASAFSERVPGAIDVTSGASSAESDARAVFLAELRKRLVTSNYGLSDGIEVYIATNGLLILEAGDAQEALRAASAALALSDDGREWRFIGNGPDLETGRYRAVVRVTPLP